MILRLRHLETLGFESVALTTRPFCDKTVRSIRHLLVQSQQGKHQKNVWNLFRVKDKDTITKSITHWTDLTYCCGVSITNFEKTSLRNIGLGIEMLLSTLPYLVAEIVARNVLWKRCFYKFCKIYRKTLVPEAYIPTKLFSCEFCPISIIEHLR